MCYEAGQRPIAGTNGSPSAEANGLQFFHMCRMLLMGNPLHFSFTDGSGGKGAGLLLFRLKLLVSMLTPKDVSRSGGEDCSNIIVKIS